MEEEKITFRSINGGKRDEASSVPQYYPQDLSSGENNKIGKKEKEYIPFLKRVADCFEKIGNFFASQYYDAKNDCPGTLSVTTRNRMIVVFVALVILLFFGIISISSASIYVIDADSGKWSSYAISQLKAILLGSLVGIAAFFFPLCIFEKKYMVWAAYGSTCLISLMVLFVGIVGGGAKRWLALGSASFQPAEFTKFGMIFILGYYLVNQTREFEGKHPEFWPTVFRYALVILPSGLVFIENASSGIIIFLIGTAMIGFSRYKSLYLIITAVFGAVVIVGGYWLYKEKMLDDYKVIYNLFDKYSYRMERVLSFLNPLNSTSDDSYQFLQGLYAIGSGGLFGRGLGSSLQKYIIPSVYNDSIFAVICEEWGIVGPVFLLLFYGLIIVFGYSFAKKLKNRPGGFFVFGFAKQIEVQTILHMLVNLGLVPFTGITLPFISYGGTSVFALLVSMGVFLNVARHFDQSSKKQVKIDSSMQKV